MVIATGRRARLATWHSSRSADAVIAIGGGWGTLAEIGLARKLGRPVILLETWGCRTARGLGARASRSPRAQTAGDAVATALAAAT